MELLPKIMLLCYLLSMFLFRRMRMSSLGGHCFVSLEEGGNYLVPQPHFCCTICHNSSSHVFPLTLSLITLVSYVQRAYRFGCSLTGWVEVIQNVQEVSSKCFSEKGFCINAQRSLKDLFLISCSAVNTLQMEKNEIPELCKYAE